MQLSSKNSGALAMSFDSIFESVSLGDVATFINGDRSTNYPKGDDYIADGIPFISAADLSDSRIQQAYVKRISNQAYDRLRNGKIRDQDILFCLRGSIGKLAFVQPNEVGAIASSLVIIRSTEKIDSRYLYYILYSQAGQQAASSLNNGSAQPNLSVGELQKVKIPLPSLVMQRDIASILNSFDDRITLLRETNTTLEAITQALFKSWFLDFDPVREKQEGNEPKGVDKITASLFPDSFEQSELGEIPKGWKIKKISSIISESTKCVGNNLPTVLSAIQTGNLVRSSDYFNKRIYSKNISKYKAVPPFYFAYNPARINIGSIGINETKELGAVSPVYIVAEPVSNYFGYYLWHHLRTSYMKEMINNLASGSVRQILSYDNFSNIPLIFAPESIIKTFFNIRSEIYEGIKSNQTTIKTLVDIKQILLSNLLSGQLRPPGLEETSNKSEVKA
jgi:type I restriction enzyme S subunit